MGKQSLIGQKFNRLLVLEEMPERKNGRIVWKCKCDCGNICYVTTSSLKNSNTKSCGCLNNEKRKENIQKYNIEHQTIFPGQKYGELTVLGESEFNTIGNKLWKCKCDCGNICYITTTNLKHQKTCGSGCKKIQYKFNDITNQKFGKLTALEPTDERKYNSVIWKCKCDCGNICFKPAISLLNGDVQSCGCLKSKGEAIIQKLLLDNNIPFETQKTFPNCVTENGDKLFFDFFVDNKYLIEFDGIQHFEQTNLIWDKLEDIQHRDQLKDSWAKINNIPLIRINYNRLPSLTIKDLLL